MDSLVGDPDYASGIPNDAVGIPHDVSGSKLMHLASHIALPGSYITCLGSALCIHIYLRNVVRVNHKKFTQACTVGIPVSPVNELYHHIAFGNICDVLCRLDIFFIFLV